MLDFLRKKRYIISVYLSLCLGKVRPFSVKCCQIHRKSSDDFLGMARKVLCGAKHGQLPCPKQRKQPSRQGLPSLLSGENEDRVGVIQPCLPLCCNGERDCIPPHKMPLSKGQISRRGTQNPLRSGNFNS